MVCVAENLFGNALDSGGLQKTTLETTLDHAGYRWDLKVEADTQKSGGISPPPITLCCYQRSAVLVVVFVRDFTAQVRS